MMMRREEIAVNLVVRAGMMCRHELLREQVKDLGERCPGALRWVRVFNRWPTIGVIYFRTVYAAERGLAWLWQERLLGYLAFIPAATIPALARAPSLRQVFVDHIVSLRNCPNAQRFRKEVDNMEKELLTVNKSLNLRDSPKTVINQLRKSQQSLLLKRGLLQKKLHEFEESLLCLEMHINGSNCNFQKAGLADKRPLFVLGNCWSWEQLHHILQRECVRLELSLPIYCCRSDIIQKVHQNRVIVLIGETGSGKSTQLVQFLADSGFAWNGSLVCTQPRKVAAMSVSRRAATESKGCYGYVDSVACNTTFVLRDQSLAMISFMTDHALLQMCISDTLLSRVSCVIVDEAHERSLSTDLLLALLKRLLLKRKDLKVIIMSATADAVSLSNYFNGCEILNVQGRNFPVDIRYIGKEEAVAAENLLSKPGHSSIPSYVSQALDVVAEIHDREEEGSVLVFLTSQAEVEFAKDQFKKPSAMAFALHGKLSTDEQVHVFENAPVGIRKVIFATNVAETSLTIPGVKFVVDTGVAKESRFEPKTGMNVLKVSQISRSTAIQRSGRAGRTQAGICYRLYTKEDFDSMAAHRDPEILRVHLGIAILKLLALGVNNLDSFDFIDAPSTDAVTVAVKNLIQLGAVKYNLGTLELTYFGSRLVKLGIEPRLGKILLDSFSKGLGREGLVLAALMANSGTIFCRVGTEAEKSRSDSLKLRFCQSDGDLFTLLQVYKEWENEPPLRRNRWCWENSINAKSMLRCSEAMKDMENCLKQELNVIIPSYWKWSPSDTLEHSVTLKKIILSSMGENLAMFSGYERSGYNIAATRQQAFIHPSCSLSALGQKPSWVVFGELLCTSRQFLVCVTIVEREWILELHPPPPYDISEVQKDFMQRQPIPKVGYLLLKRFCGKGNCKIQILVRQLQLDCKSMWIGIEVDHEKHELYLFAAPDCMRRSYDLVDDALSCERRWLHNQCMEKLLFCPSNGKHSPIALLGRGAEIKHIEFSGKFLSVEVSHPNVNSLNDRQLLLAFESCVGSIAGFHRFPNGGNAEDNGKWGTITFFSSEAAETAVCKLNNADFEGSHLSVHRLGISHAFEAKEPGYPAVKATLRWPQRKSKGLAIIKCGVEDVDRIALSCAEKLIGNSCVRCRRGKEDGSVFMTGLDVDVTEHILMEILKGFTPRKILGVHILRYPANQFPTGSECEAALLKELAAFLPLDKCQVVVLNSDSKEYFTCAQVTFDGSIHLRAARALSHLEGKVLSCCLSWQKITCQQTFFSTLLFPYRVFTVLEDELNYLLKSSQHDDPGFYFNKSRTEFGSCKIRISSDKMETVAKCRFLLDKLLKGTVIKADSLDPESIHQLFSVEGDRLIESLENKTKTCIIFEKRSLSIKIYGPDDKLDLAVKNVHEGLELLSENVYHRINLRNEGFPDGLMKEIVNRYGVDLLGLKELVPETEFVLDTRRHILCVQGSKENKIKVSDLIMEIGISMKGVDGHVADLARDREDACPICFCDVENAFTLEECGHSFCRSCLVDQCSTAIRHHDGFPLVCSHDNCTGLLLISDLKSLLSGDQLEDLFRASLGAFVASSRGSYRFCSTPDCSSIYEVSTSGRLFVCGNCSAELCTSCHLEYHPYLSCEAYRAYKDDPDASFKEWCEAREDVKWCVSCGFAIEKTEGCNHVICKCGKHICWVCLEIFNDTASCYNHLHNVHGRIH